MATNWLTSEDERICDASAMRQWEASRKRPDLSEEDRVKGAIEAFKRHAIALYMHHPEADSPIKRLCDAVEGECDGLAISEAQASAILDYVNAGQTFQARVYPWMMACFGEEISNDKVERSDRLLEEVFELLQSGGYDPARVLALRNYVWGRPAGEPFQEAGGVQVTMAAYCLAHGINMHGAGECELNRIWSKVEKIRAKQAAKPVGSALPIPVASEDDLFIGVGSEVRRRNRAGAEDEKGAISPSCEQAALSLVVDALNAQGFEIVRAVTA